MARLTMARHMLVEARDVHSGYSTHLQAVDSASDLGGGVAVGDLCCGDLDFG